MDRRRDRCLQPWQRLFDPLDRIDDVGAGLFEYDQEDAALAVLPGCNQPVFRPVDGAADIPNPHGRAVAVRQNDVVVLRPARELVVVVNGERLVLSVDTALWRIDGGGHQQVPHVLERHAHGCDLVRIDLDADGRLLLAADDHLGDAGDLRDLLRQHILGVIVALDQRHGI